MFKSTIEFNSAIKEILTTVRDGKDINSDDSTIEQEDFWEAVVECIDRRYIIGVTYNRLASGAPVFQSKRPRITYSGLAFIEAN